MSVTLVRQKVKEERLEEAERAVRDWFGVLDREGPAGLRYASTRVADSSTFVILTELDEGIDDPVRRCLSSSGSWSSSRAS